MTKFQQLIILGLLREKPLHGYQLDQKIRGLATTLGPMATSTLYAQMKATTRVRDLTSGDLRYQWTETGALAHYRHAQAFDHIAGCYRGTANVYFF